MNVDILIEPIADSGFRALSGEPLHLVANAPTRDEVIAKIRELIESRLAAGAEVVSLTVGAASHPLASHIGSWQDDALLGEWRAAVEEYREQRDSASEAQQ